MKGVVLAGDVGEGLSPMTRLTDMHLLPVYDRPMIHYPIQTLLNAGIDEILLVTGGAHAGDFLRMLGNGRALGLRRLSYTCRDGAGGLRATLELAEHFADRDRVCVIRGDTVIGGNVLEAARQFRHQASGARLVLAETDDPGRCAIARFDGNRILDLVDRPARPPSSLALSGIGFYDESLFEVARSATPRSGDELRWADVSRTYLRRGDLTWSRLDGWWESADSFDRLHRAACLVTERGANRLDPQLGLVV